MSRRPLPDEDFFRRDALACARDLIGMELAHGPCRGIVLETEAYRETGDP
ncbi:MAG: DNA-3-methyladenine glycosylase, partial [Burkholderiaceae bacterium]|nr:DNA-3-methyladenine glycosylase [Burkholderiaceae bacterium]